MLRTFLARHCGHQLPPPAVRKRFREEVVSSTVHALAPHRPGGSDDSSSRTRTAPHAVFPFRWLSCLQGASSGSGEPGGSREPGGSGAELSAESKKPAVRYVTVASGLSQHSGDDGGPFRRTL